MGHVAKTLSAYGLRKHQADAQENATPILRSERHTSRQDSWDCALGMTV